MSKADELIAGLHSDAEFDSDGGFSLDRDKARDKMRQFQLADPHRYVLLLVEAAVLRGATRIEFRIDTDDMIMRFDAALDWADLDELYSSLFVDRTSVEIRARRELALACNAAMALNPRFIAITSARRDGGQVSGVRALLRPDTADEIARDPQAALAPDVAAETRIHVKERFRPGLLVRFVHTVGDALPEVTLLRQRCRLASVAIVVNDVQVSGGLPAAEVPFAHVSFAAPGLRGVAGLRTGADQRERSALVLVSNGVEISTTELDDSVPGLWFWVDASNLRKDVSQAAIVRSDPAYSAMLVALGEARDRVLGALVEGWRTGQCRDEGPLTGAQAYDLLRACFLRWADAAWLGPSAGPLRGLAELPLWRTADEGWISPLALVEQADPERGIMFTERDFGGVTPHGWGPIVRLLDARLEREAITRVHPNARDVSEALEREVPWERNRRRWRASPHGPSLPAGAESLALPGGQVHIDVRRSVRDGDVTVEALARLGDRSHVRVVVDGHLLAELDFDCGVLGVAAVVAGPFTPQRDYASVELDRAFARAALLVLAQVPELLAGLADIDGFGRAPAFAQLLRRSMLGLASSDLPVRWLQAFGFPAAAAKAMVERLGAPPLLPTLGLGAQPTALARLTRFATVDGLELDLVEIDAERRARPRAPGMVLLVDAAIPASLGMLDEVVLRVTAQERALLAAIFGAERLHDDTREVRRKRGRQRFLARSTVVPTVPEATWTAAVDLDTGAQPGHGRVHGQVGMVASAVLAWRADASRYAQIEVIVEDRRLAKLEVLAWLPGLVASLCWDQAPVSDDWDALASQDKQARPLQQAVNAGALAILDAQIAALRAAPKEASQGAGGRTRPTPAIRRLLWLALTAPFLSTEHAAAWRMLRLAHPREQAIEAYLALLSLFPAVPLADLRSALKLLLDDHVLPTREALLELLGPREQPQGLISEFQRAALERYDAIAELPLLATSAIDVVVGPDLVGRRVDRAASLRQLEQHYASADEIAYLEDPAVHYDDPEYLIVRADPIDQVALLRLFERERFKEVSAWIHEQGQQQRFTRQAPLDAIRVPDRDRLVGVEFERDGVTGELVIPPWVPGEAGLMKLTFCHQRRVVETIELHAKQPILGIVDDPQAPVSGDYTSVDTRSPRMAMIRKLLDEVLDTQLLPALADAFPSLGAREQQLARAWIVDHWRRISPKAGQHANRLTAAGRRFAALPLFQDVDGRPRSLHELSDRYAEHGTLWLVEVHPGHPVPPPFPVLLCAAQDRPLLDLLFDEVEDYAPRWGARVDGERRKQRAPSLPSPAAPPDRLVEAAVERHGLSGAVWLPAAAAFTSGVALGCEGRLLVVRELLDVLPCCGVVDGVPADDGFTTAALGNAQARYLDARPIELYGALLDDHRHDLGAPERPEFDAPEQLHLRGLRLELLRRAAVGLAQARRRGRAIDAILGNLERRLDAEPLLRLASGRLISVDVARRARPIELAHLDVWDPDGPPVDPAERARLLGEELAQAPVGEASGAGRAEVAAGIEPAQTEVAPVIVVPMPSESEPVPAPAPAPAPEPAQMDELVELRDAAGQVVPLTDEQRVGQVLERIRGELRLLREQHDVAVSEGHLDRLTAAPADGKRLLRTGDAIQFDSAHPRFVRAKTDLDPIWISFLASVAYTALNHALDEVSDQDELRFHDRHAELLLSARLGAAQP